MSSYVIQLNAAHVSEVKPGLVRVISQAGSVVELRMTSVDGLDATAIRTGHAITAWCSADGIARRWKLDYKPGDLDR